MTVQNVEIKMKRGSLTISKSEDSELHVVSDTPVVPDFEGDTAVINLERMTGSITLTVLLPSSAKALDVGLGRGPCHITGVPLESADLNIGLGTCTLEESSGTWDINVGKGDLDIRKSSGQFDINVGMGQCRLTHLTGQADINAGLGPVKAEDCNGIFDVNAGKGDVTWTEGQGSVDINAGLGDVRTTNGRGTVLDITAGLGKIFVQGGTWQKAQLEVGIGSIHAEAYISELSAQVRNHGAIEVSLPISLGARVEASTEHGRIISHLTLIPVGHSGPQRGQRLVGVIGDGVGRINLETRRGNITLTQHDDLIMPDRESLPHATVNDPFTQSRMLILEQLQDGRLTVDEAEKLLEGLQ